VLQERQRLARELHDSVTQLIFSTTLIAQSIGAAWRRDPAEGQQRAERVLELSRQALAEMRALLLELRPPEASGAAVNLATLPAARLVEREGLVAALRRHTDDLKRDGLQVALDAGGYEALPFAQEEALFRIAQEALHNVAKHAHAQHVEIDLSVAGNETRLAVRDDGAGFAPGRPEASFGRQRPRGAKARPMQGGYGLITMRERAAALGGVVQVTSAPGAGTTVEVRLPQPGTRRHRRDE
jgi:signal transduction histidine kinase